MLSELSWNGNSQSRRFNPGWNLGRRISVSSYFRTYRNTITEIRRYGNTRNHRHDEAIRRGHDPTRGRGGPTGEEQIRTRAEVPDADKRGVTNSPAAQRSERTHEPRRQGEEEQGHEEEDRQGPEEVVISSVGRVSGPLLPQGRGGPYAFRSAPFACHGVLGYLGSKRIFTRPGRCGQQARKTG